MAGPKKRVTLISHSPYVYYSDYQTPWDDVWLVFEHKRKKRYLGPTLCGRLDLLNEIRSNKALLISHPEHKDTWEEELLKSELSLDEINIFDFACEDIDSDMPTLYTSKDRIDKDEAEVMIHRYLALLGYRNCKLVWRKNKKRNFIQSISL